MFDALIVEPFGWILRQVYNLVGSYGWAIVIFTIIAKLILLPFQMKSKKSMVDMQRVQPKLKELEKKYKDDKERYSKEVQKLYKKEGVSMFGGCLPIIIMFPIMIGLYSVIRQPLTHIFNLSADQIAQLADAMRNAGATIAEAKSKGDYLVEIGVASNLSSYFDVAKAIVPTIEQIDFTFCGIDLTAIPNFKYITVLWAIPALSGLTSWGYSWLTRKMQGPMAAAQQSGMSSGLMNILMPLMSVWIAFMVPTGLGVYWIISNILSAIQEPILTYYYKNKQKKKEALQES